MKYNAKYYHINNKKPEHRRHDMSDKMWSKLVALLPEHMGKGGRPSADSRTFIDAVFWVLRTGAPWRDFPPDYGNWKSRHGTHKRGLNSKIHLAVDAYGRVVRVFITAGTTNDCKLGIELFQGLDIIGLMADRGYDTNTIIEFARKCGIEIYLYTSKEKPQRATRI